MHPALRSFIGLLAVLAVVVWVSDRPSGQVFRSGIEIVQVTATVRGADGRLIGDLSRDDFEITEDGVPQSITLFQKGRVPVSLGVVLDVSQSMYGQRMDDARHALERFLVDLLNPSDEVFLIVFNHDPKIEEGWTAGPARLQGRLDHLRPYGATAIYDAMALALPLFETRSYQRAAVVLISDGADTRATPVFVTSDGPCAAATRSCTRWPSMHRSLGRSTTPSIHTRCGRSRTKVAATRRSFTTVRTSCPRPNGSLKS